MQDVVGPGVRNRRLSGASSGQLPPFQTGDLMAVMTAGAYGAVMSSTYNTRLLVPEVLVNGDAVRRCARPGPATTISSAPIAYRPGSKAAKLFKACIQSQFSTLALCNAGAETAMVGLPMDRKASPGAFRDPAFERKIWRARIVGAFEQAWLRLWLVLAVVCLFLVVSFAGIWPYLGYAAHVALLGLFGAGLIAAVCMLRASTGRHARTASGASKPFPACRTARCRPTRIRSRAAPSDPTTQAIWQAHRARMAALLRGSSPASRTRAPTASIPWRCAPCSFCSPSVLTLRWATGARSHRGAFEFPASDGSRRRASTPG